MSMSLKDDREDAHKNQILFPALAISERVLWKTINVQKYEFSKAVAGREANRTTVR